MNHADRFHRMPAGFDLARAMAEADRCLLCHEAPCSTACPAATDPGTFIRKLRLKNITGAIRTIKQNNILGGACGVLCPTAKLCERECSAVMRSKACPGGDDSPVRIGMIQRFLVEHAWRTGFKVFAKPKADGPKVAVVGSGPAGLSCAAELARSGHRVTIFEARPEPGGVLRYGVVAYRFDADFLSKELADIDDLGVTIVCNSPIDSRRTVPSLLDEGFEAVFIATGLWSADRLNTAATEVSGRFASVDYLAALRNGGFDAMATALRGKTVAVIGGGSVAMDCAESAVRLGARDVYLVYRRSYVQMPAEEEERRATLLAGVHYLMLNQPVEIVSDTDHRLTGLELDRTRLGDPDDSGRKRPERVAGSRWTLPCDVVIEAIGNSPAEESERWYPHVAVDGGRLIQADPETRATSVPGVFAGGDIVRGPALVVQAVQDGKLAARAICDYLRAKEVRP